MTTVEIEHTAPDHVEADPDDMLPIMVTVHIVSPLGGVHGSLSLPADASDADIADAIVRAAEATAHARGGYLPVALYARMRADQ